MGGFKPEWWASSSRNRGRVQPGISTGAGPAPRPRYRRRTEKQALATDYHHHFVEMPLRAGAGTALAKFPGDRHPEFEHPAPDRLVGDVQAALGKEVLNVTIAQGKAKIEPDCVLDDGRRKLVTSIGDRGHLVIVPVRKRQDTVRVTMPARSAARVERRKCRATRPLPTQLSKLSAAGARGQRVRSL